MQDPRPCVVYLDTSDCSRFGDVLRGKANANDERLFEELCELGKSGAAVFPCSGPMLAELLQYDAHHRETTMCKARSVEALSAGYAFIGPDRLVALEVAQAAHSVGLLDKAPRATVLTTDWYWHPNAGNVFVDMKGEIERSLKRNLASSGHNRQTRRVVKSKARKMSLADWAEGAEKFIPEIARKWGISEEGVHASVIAAMTGKATPEQASRILFSSVATPTAFVDFYFEGYDGEKDLPIWMSKFGAGIQTAALKFRESLRIIPNELRPTLMTSFRAEVSSKLADIGMTLVKMLDRDDYEFGVSGDIIDRFVEDKDLARLVPANVTLSKMIVQFALDSTDEASPEPERSTGGDFIHALYARYSDLWRGDRRFSHFLKRTVPELSDKIVNKATDLPKRIRQFHDAI